MEDKVRILIYGQAFNNFSGGGITLSNLFKGWPKQNIAVLSTPFGLQNVSYDICDNYYKIGREEYHWKFPFSLYKKTYSSGIDSCIKPKPEFISERETGFKQLLSAKLLDPVIKWFGLSHCISSINISSKLKAWLAEFKPDILYIQVSNREGILFVHNLIEYLNNPSVIHMMDDWPSSISLSGPLKNFWGKKIDREFRQLLDKVDLHLSISDAMSAEYCKRYSKAFIPFHNPIDISVWQSHSKTDFKLSNDHIKILFSGRIGTGIYESIKETAVVIDDLCTKGNNIILYVQSPSNDHNTLKELGRFRNIVINPPARYEDLPDIYSNADILLILNDFDAQSVQFLKLSMPTKASEYMISGTPILVYSHSETAVSKFFTENKCGYCVTENESDKLSDAIMHLIEDESYRRKISYNAVTLATERFDSEKVRHEFQNLLITTAKITKY